MPLVSPIIMLTIAALPQMRTVGSPRPGALGAGDVVRSLPRKAAWHHRSFTLSALAPPPPLHRTFLPHPPPAWWFIYVCDIKSKVVKSKNPWNWKSNNANRWAYVELPYVASSTVNFKCCIHTQCSVMNETKIWCTFCPQWGQVWWLKCTYSAHAYGGFVTCYKLSRDASPRIPPTPSTPPTPRSSGSSPHEWNCIETKLSGVSICAENRPKGGQTIVLWKRGSEGKLAEKDQECSEDTNAPLWG